MSSCVHACSSERILAQPWLLYPPPCVSKNMHTLQLSMSHFLARQSIAIHTHHICRKRLQHKIMCMFSRTAETSGAPQMAQAEHAWFLPCLHKPKATQWEVQLNCIPYIWLQPASTTHHARIRAIAYSSSSLNILIHMNVLMHVCVDAAFFVIMHAYQETSRAFAMACSSLTPIFS